MLPVKIVPRKTALASGLNRYYTGDRCKHGHQAERYTLNSACTECVYARVKLIRERFREAKVPA